VTPIVLGTKVQLVVEVYDAKSNPIPLTQTIANQFKIYIMDSNNNWIETNYNANLVSGWASNIVEFDINNAAIAATNHAYNIRAVYNSNYVACSVCQISVV